MILASFSHSESAPRKLGRPLAALPSLRASRRRKRKSGFTLLEVLIALAIFVGATAILSRLILIGVESAEFSHRQTEAWLIAESHMAEFESGILTIDSAGTFVDEQHPQWQWTLQTEATPTTGLYRIVIAVSRTSDKTTEQSSFRLVRLYFDESSVETEESETTTQ